MKKIKNLLGIGKTEKSNNTISAGIRTKTLNQKSLIRAVKHNYRLVKSQSTTNEDGIRCFNLDGKPIEIKLKTPDDAVEYASKVYSAQEKSDAQKFNSLKPTRQNGKSAGRRIYYSDRKHNSFSEMVIHAGKTHGKKIESDEAVFQLVQNVNRWLAKHDYNPLKFAPVIHFDEVGDSHIHILMANGNSINGSKNHISTEIGESLQDEIFVGMAKFGLRRADRWSENNDARKKRLSIPEYKKMMDDDGKIDNRSAVIGQQIMRIKSLRNEIVELEKASIENQIKNDEKLKTMDANFKVEESKRKAGVDATLNKYRRVEQDEYLENRSRALEIESSKQEEKKLSDSINNQKVELDSLKKEIVKLNKERTEKISGIFDIKDADDDTTDLSNHIIRMASTVADAIAKHPASFKKLEKIQMWFWKYSSGMLLDLPARELKTAYGQLVKYHGLVSKLENKKWPVFVDGKKVAKEKSEKVKKTKWKDR